MMNIANIILDYTLIFGKFGFPRLEVKGAAIASLVSSFIGAAYFFALVVNNGFVKRFRWISSFTFDLSILSSILKFAFPAMIRVFFIMAGLTIFLWIVGRIGNVELAASNILMTLSSFTFLVGYGFAIAGDTGGAIKGNIIDLGFEDARTAGWRAKFVDIYLL